MHPENTYVNGKTGIYVANANDSFRVNGMGFVYLENALTIYNADALSIHDNLSLNAEAVSSCAGGDRHQRSPTTWWEQALRATRSTPRTMAGS